MRFLVSLLLVLLVAQHAAASEVVFDYVGVPSNTAGSAALTSSLNIFGVGGSEYYIGATRFTLGFDSVAILWARWCTVHVLTVSP
jgi:hypothetical protein